MRASGARTWAALVAFLLGRLLRSPASLALFALTALGSVTVLGFSSSAIPFDVWTRGVAERAGVTSSVLSVQSLEADSGLGATLRLSSPVAAARLRPWFRRRHVTVEQIEELAGPAAVGNGGETLVVVMTIRAPDPLAVPGLHRARLLFGAGEVDLVDRVGDAVSFRVARRQVVRLLVRRGAGLLGLLVAVFVAAGLLPTTMRGGAVDLLFPRALGRGAVLLATYVAGVAFGGLHGGLVVLGFALVGGLGAAAIPGLALGVFPVWCFFVALLAIAVLGGALGRSRALGVVLALAVWLAGAGAWSYVPASELQSTRDRAVDVGRLPTGLEQFLLAARQALPNPGAVDARVDAAIVEQSPGLPKAPPKAPSPYPALAAWAVLSLLLAALHLRRVDL